MKEEHRMVNMSEESGAFLKEHLPELLEMKDINEILERLDAFMLEEGFDAEYNANELWRQAAIVYDEIYCCNE